MGSFRGAPIFLCSLGIWARKGARQPWKMSTSILCMLVLFGSCVALQAEHMPQLSWMQGTYGREGMSCCGQRDCVEVPVQHFGEGFVMVGDVPMRLPLEWIHPSSDGHGYWCFKPDPGTEPYIDQAGIRRFPVPPITEEQTRCVFYASQG